MKILRSVSQRGFSVATAGWFTILRPNTWFPASRLPKNLPSLGVQTQGKAEQRTRQDASGGGGGTLRAVRWLALERIVEDRNRMRFASAVLAGLTITTAMLWWIMHA